MVETNQTDVAMFALRLADDALVLGQRLTEWCGHGPFLEEDLALANTALDYLGRARFFYQFAGGITGRSEDELAYTRDVRAFTNHLIYELPRQDFAFTMARQFLIDAFMVPYLQQLTLSQEEGIAAVAAKAVKESRYHLRRSSEWIERLGDGTAESHARLVRALDQLAGYTDEMFEMDALESRLAAEGVAVDRDRLQAPWRQTVDDTLALATLPPMARGWSVTGGRTGVHTEHLGPMLAELQFMQRAYPGLEW
jgi:ring-1,2-phenylacetyl-CoA epoxidase subunit PaaC